ILLSDQCGKLSQESPISICKRIQESSAERLIGCRIDHCSVANELAAASSEDGTFAKPPPAKLRVIKDSCASTNHGLVMIQRPGKPHGRLEVLVVFFRRTQITTVDRSQERGLGKIVIEKIGLMFPSQSKIHGEIGLELPRILRIKMEALIVFGI